jgi:hypothetical protein
MERAGHFGAQLELMAADQLANTQSAVAAGNTKKSEGKRARRRKVFKDLILERYQGMSAYALEIYTDEFAAAVERYNRTVEPNKKLTMVAQDTFNTDLKAILRDIRSSKIDPTGQGRGS